MKKIILVLALITFLISPAWATLSVTVTKQTVTNPQEGLYILTIHVVLTDTAGPGFTKDYSLESRKSESVTDKIQQFISLIQKDIDAYKNAQSIYNLNAFTNLVNNVQGGLVLN